MGKKILGLGIAGAFTILSLTSCGGAGGASPEISTPITTASSGSGTSGMTMGDIQQLNFSNGSASVDFNSADDYFLVVNSTSQIGDDISLQLNRGSAAALIEGEAPSGLASEKGDCEAVPEGCVSPYEDPASQFHQYLREMETVMRESGEFAPLTGGSSSQAGLTAGGPAAAVTPPAAPSVGDAQDFHVISTMGSITNYAEVTGELRLATDNLYVFVDQSVRDNISDADVSTLAHNFEDIALPRERAIMGGESDINFDGHISILMTCVVNRMAGTGGIVTGFFFPGDLYQRSGVNPASNAQEIFYTLVPDPDGKCGTAITSSFAVNNILPGVIGHEYQHMNSFNQHVFKNGGSTEEPWLNECLSHFAEDMTGYGNENPSRVKLFLSQPSKTPLVPSTSPTLAERGACYTFLRYLYEQSPDGNAFLSRLYESNKTGVANLEAAFQGTDPDFNEFPEFVNRWSIALALSGTGLTSDARYNFRERSVDPQTGNKTGICIRCDVQDGRGTVLDGPVMSPLTTFPNTTIVKGTATQFYRLNTPSGEIQVNGGANNDFEGSLITLQKS